MFKKPVNLSPRTSLGAKEKKKIKAVLKEKFPQLKDEEADLLLPQGELERPLGDLPAGDEEVTEAGQRVVGLAADDPPLAEGDPLADLLPR